MRTSCVSAASSAHNDVSEDWTRLPSALFMQSLLKLQLRRIFRVHSAVSSSTAVTSAYRYVSRALAQDDPWALPTCAPPANQA